MVGLKVAHLGYYLAGQMAVQMEFPKAECLVALMVGMLVGRLYLQPSPELCV